MKLSGILLSEISQTERKIVYGITYMWNLKGKKRVYFIETENGGCPGVKRKKNGAIGQKVQMSSCKNKLWGYTWVYMWLYIQLMCVCVYIYIERECIYNV